MLKIITTSLCCFFLLATKIQAQTTTYSNHGNTLNIGIGVGGYSGYYGYLGRTLPVVNLNYEFEVAKNFTLAPSISFYSYRNNHYWGSQKDPNDRYYYTETVIPLALKGSYYLDQLLQLNSNWDIYLAGSLGFAIVQQRWAPDYTGDRNLYRRANPLFLDIHAGVEYHVNSNIGLYLDLSNGVSMLGISIK